MKSAVAEKLLLMIMCLVFAAGFPLTLMGQSQDVTVEVDGRFPVGREGELSGIFTGGVNSWLGAREPKLISKSDTHLHMQVNYVALFNVVLGIRGQEYKISVWPVDNKKRRRSQKYAVHIANGINNIIKDRFAAEIEREDKEFAGQQEAARIAELIRQFGDLKAYPIIAGYRYKKCHQIADVYLDVDNVRYKRELNLVLQYDAELDAIRECAKDAEVALGEDVRRALFVAPEGVSAQLKDLHAYVIASLRALTNFHQSPVEARQSRAERSAGIDERMARIELEL